VRHIPQVGSFLFAPCTDLNFASMIRVSPPMCHASYVKELIRSAIVRLDFSLVTFSRRMSLCASYFLTGVVTGLCHDVILDCPWCVKHARVWFSSVHCCRRGDSDPYLALHAVLQQLSSISSSMRLLLFNVLSSPVRGNLPCYKESTYRKFPSHTPQPLRSPRVDALCKI
jgi:hypothetical protein